MSKEAMKLALEALKQIDEAMPFPIAKLAQAALREALAEQPAQQALDKMAENARELGIQMQPEEPRAWFTVDELNAWADKKLKENPQWAEQPAQQEPVGCEGAIVNGRVYADRLEHDYKFECEAGPLHLCNDWVEFRRCFEWLAQHTPQPAQQEPVAGKKSHTSADNYGASYETSDRAPFTDGDPSDGY